MYYTLTDEWKAAQSARVKEIWKKRKEQNGKHT